MELLKVSSVSDVISNSSSEVFIINKDYNIDMFAESIAPVKVKIFNTDDDIKNFVMHCFYNKRMDMFSVHVGVLFNPLNNYDMWSSYMYRYDKSFDDLWNLFNDDYMVLKNYAVIDFDMEMSNDADDAKKAIRNYIKEYGGREEFV